MSDEVVLSIAGRQYAGWTEARIQRGIEQVSGQFSLTVSERWPGQVEPWPIRPGDACALAVDGTVVITGHVDDVFPQFDANGHVIQISGRDAVADLIDCSAALRPGRWENRTLTQIAADIARPFGIAVAADADVGPAFRVFAVQPGESAFEAIERACRFRGVLPVSDGRGGLLLTGPGVERLSVALVQGENILAASAALSWRDRFSAYTALGQSAGSDESTPEQNSSPAGRATDPVVTRHRPLIVIAEESADAAGLTRRAMWEAAVRRGRSTRAVINVQGWSHPGGVWAPNRRVPVRSEWLRLDAELLIVSVHMVRDASGTRTEIEVCPPEGLKPMQISEAAEDVLW